MTGVMPGAEPVHQEAVEAEVVGHSMPIPASYADRFVMQTSVRATAREWAMAAFELGIPRTDRDLVFQRALGLRTGPDGLPASVAGWTVEEEDEGRIRLAAAGRSVAGNLVVECADASVSLTTVLGFSSRWRRWVWAVLSRKHRQVAAPTLRHAAELLRQSA